MRAFWGFSSSEATKPSSLVIHFYVASNGPGCYAALARTTTTPLLAALAAASTEALFMLPLPTPAMVAMPSAPFFTHGVDQAR